MFACLYIVLCMLTGYVLCCACLPKLKEAGARSYSGKELNLSPWLILIPSWYLVGSLIVTWFVYFSALIISLIRPGIENPLFYANILAFAFFILADGAAFLLMRKKNQDRLTLPKRLSLSFGEIILLVLCSLFVIFLMFYTFHVKDNAICTGFSVFSDFAPHLGMIRSFSFGNNFPTQYSHYAGEDIRYHFMFQFMVGNLEYLGMRIDYAFNVPSILSMIFVCILLYVYGAKLTSKRMAGGLSVLFFLFRSSPNFFRYLAEFPTMDEAVESLKTMTEFISYTPNDGWGLFNLNVYCNQRHLCFSLAIMLLALLLFTPYVYQMFRRLRQLQASCNAEDRTPSFQEYMKEFLLNKEAVLPDHLLLPVFFGLILGGIGFWNGAVLIACLAVLFVMALASNHRLNYLITAVIAVTLTELESMLFVEGSVVSPSFYFGFIAENKTIMGVWQYLLELWGLLLLIIVLYLFLGKGVKRYMTIAFSAPLIAAFTLSLTPDITVNHKYIMISAMLFSIIAAFVITRLWEHRRLAVNMLALFLVVIMTATGIFDFVIVVRKNKNYVKHQLDDPIIEWVSENTTSKDIFLSSHYSLHQIVLGGGMLYYGWPYFAWSAGYDTNYRLAQVKEMYGADNAARLQELIEENNISYIVIDRDNRTSTDYVLNEELIDATYEAVYTQGEGEWKFTIYDTSQKKNE